MPGTRTLGLIRHDWPLMIAEGETTRYIGDVLAIVAAETEEIARTAVGLIDVEYSDILEPLTDPFVALREESRKIHDSGNVLSRSVTSRGDVAAARVASAFVAQGHFETQRIEHGFMEPEAAIAIPGEGSLELLSQGQGIYDDREQIASMLGLPLEQGARDAGA